jgi:hypothetical protein
MDPNPDLRMTNEQEKNSHALKSSQVLFELPRSQWFKKKITTAFFLIEIFLAANILFFGKFSCSKYLLSVRYLVGMSAVASVSHWDS